MIAALIHGAACATVAVTWFRGAAARMHAAALARGRRTAYDSVVPDKEGNWGESQNQEGARTAQSRFFSCVHAFVRPQWTAVAGESQDSTVPSCRSLKPRHSPSTPFESGVGGLTAQEGGYMPSCTRTPEQPPLHKTISDLLAKLQKAEQIICVMLNAMTPAQKLKAVLRGERERKQIGGAV